MIGTVLRQIRGKYRTAGFGGCLEAISREALSRQYRRSGLLRRLVSGVNGLEIGGPSTLFAAAGYLPIYPMVARMDSINFASQTIWEGSIEAGWTFRYDKQKQPGQQFIGEGGDLSFLPNASYGCVASSHSLEHLANPLRGLEEWSRVLVDGGTLLLIVPHRDRTFDHRRPVTTLAHMIEDYRNGTGEDDLTHIEEVVQLHDMPDYHPATKADLFRSALQANYRDRTVHHHVFDTRTAVQMLDHVGLQIEAVDTVEPCNIVAIARKLAAGHRPDNTAFLDPKARFLRFSHFPTDKAAAADR